MGSNVRCFLAIDLEDSIKEDFLKVQDEFKMIDSNVKYVESENLHLTLKFFGDLDEDEIKSLKLAIKEVLNNFKSFDVNISSVGAFPNSNYIKVIWVGVKSKYLLKLQKDLDKEFELLGFKKEKNHVSHITIGRVRGSKKINDLKNKINKLKDVKLKSTHIKEIKLKKSKLTRQGPIYSDIEVFKLDD